MGFFRFAYKQSTKGLGRTFLFSMVVGLVFAVSILVVLFKGMSNIDNKELKEFESETGCKLVNYELQCDVTNYESDGFIIDLNYDGTSTNNDNLILTKDKVYAQANAFTYEQLLEMFGETDGDFNVDDAIELTENIFVVIYVMGFFGSFIGSAIFFLIANILLAAIMLLFFNKTRIKFDQMYKLVMLTIIPYVLFNAVIRMIFGSSLAVLITSEIPFLGNILHIVIDYAAIYGLTYLAIKEGKNLQPIAQEVKVEENNVVW